MRRLIIRPGGIGDCILSFPAIEHLRADYTEVWIRSDVVPLVRFADSVRPIAATGLDLVGIGSPNPQATMTALGSFDSIVSWYGANRPEFREAVADLPFEFHAALPEDDRVHAADFFLSQVGGQPPAMPRIECHSPRLDFAAIHPFSGSRRKNWPLDRFQQLAEQMPVPVEWYAGPEEELPGALRITDLYDVARRLASARVYIGNDSGITQLAAAAGVPVVALFGPTDPHIWGPRGERVRIIRGKTMDAIPVSRVFEAAIALC